MPRNDGRRPDELRPVKIKRRFTRNAPGSVYIQAGGTVLLCTASVEESVPAWLAESGKGWITAEYAMLPGSTPSRKPRRNDGRATEIQRLIGRSLRAVADLEALGPRTITLDCDVIDADGGTRTAAVTGAFIALVDAIRSIAGKLPDPKRYPLRESVAAVSVGIVEGHCLLDLNYREDTAAEVDMNVVMTGGGKFVELQGTGEEAVFDQSQLQKMLKLAAAGAAELTAIQHRTLGRHWPLA